MISFGRVSELYIDDLFFDSRDLSIRFSVPFDDGPEANIAEIRVFNLSNDTINKIKKNSKVILNAGYRDDYGAIVLGIIKDVNTTWAGVDKITTMHVLDGSDSWFNMPFQKTYAPGLTAEDILIDLTVNTALQIGAFSLPDNVVYKSGRTVKGTLANVIKTIAADCGAKAHVTRGKIFIRPKDEGDNIGFTLNADTGLISSPTPLEKEVQTDKKDDDGKKIKYTKTGWNVRCLLNHRIATDSLIQITSKTANGFFRVESGRHNGDAYETELEVYPI